MTLFKHSSFPLASLVLEHGRRTRERGREGGGERARAKAITLLGHGSAGHFHGHGGAPDGQYAAGLALSLRGGQSRVERFVNSDMQVVACLLAFKSATAWQCLCGCCVGSYAHAARQDFVKDTSQELTDREWIWWRYGTAFRAMYTLFEITFVPSAAFLHICWLVVTCRKVEA